MKTILTIFAALMLVSGGPAAAKTPAAAQDAASGKEAKEAGFRDILTKLLRQDEELDEALLKLDSAKPLPAREFTTMGLTLKQIAGTLQQASAMNRREFSAVSPDTGVSSYTNAILSYSRKVDQKTALISSLVAGLAQKNKKSAVRDAVSSRKAKKAGGRKLTQLLAEQNALLALAADAKKLRGAAKDLSATSRWLYIASK